jgi:oligoribonuclease NrnB/cAMP/cGMP phosphodiesterase (DHH superfamily)
MKQCFECRRMLSLDNFTDNKRHYTLKTDLGKNRVCKICTFERAVKNRSIVQYNFEDKKFDNIKFDDIGQVAEFFIKHNMI